MCPTLLDKYIHCLKWELTCSTLPYHLVGYYILLDFLIQILLYLLHSFYGIYDSSIFFFFFFSNIVHMLNSWSVFHASCSISPHDVETSKAWISRMAIAGCEARERILVTGWQTLLMDQPDKLLSFPTRYTSPLRESIWETWKLKPSVVGADRISWWNDVALDEPS